MARKSTMSPIQLDAEVSALVQRVGTSDDPKVFMRDYSVMRPNVGATWVTVTFLADDEFCRPQVEVTGLDKAEPEFIPGQQAISIEDGGK